MRKLMSMILALLLVMSLTLGIVPEREAKSAPAPVDVTVTIWRFIEVQNPDPLAGDGDYYARVRIGSFGWQTSPQITGTDIMPFWTFTQTVDDSVGAVPVTIEIWDLDGVLTKPDDIIDLNPTDDVQQLILSFNLATGSWSGDVPTNQQFSEGDGDREHFGFTEGGERGRVFFNISVSSNGDSDGDSLLDAWERFGLDADGDGTIDVNLPGMGADPRRRDIFVEIDYLADDANNNGAFNDAVDHSHTPQQGAIQQVVQSFANAPVPNPDGTTGIELHVDTGTLYGAGNVINVPGTGGVTGTFGDLGEGGNLIDEEGNAIVDWDGAAGRAGTSFYTLKTANFNPLRRLVFRYSLFVHQTNARRAANDTTSGWAESITGNDFFVSLGGTNTAGNPAWGTDANGFSVGSQAEQAGTFMHELGHVLNLRHGGDDDTNNEPNYLSVMNYSFTMAGVISQPAVGLPGGADYSRFDLPDLNELSLDENLGIDGILNLGPVDWNGDGTLNVNVQADINGDSAQTNLTSFDDWQNLVYNFRNVSAFQDGVASPVPDEPDSEIIEQARQRFTQLFRPDLEVTKSVNLADAFAGDTLTYTVTVENKGRGPATNIELVDTLPDGTSETRYLGNLYAKSQTTKTFTYVVPLPNAPLTVLTNTATVTGEDLLGNPDEDSSNNTDTAITVLHNRPPVTDANGPYIGYEGSPIVFDGTGSYDLDGTIVKYEWDLDGDGQYNDATGANPSKTWGDDYSGTIGLRVTDNIGAEATDSTTVLVKNVAPTANAGPDQEFAVVGKPVNFQGSHTDPGWLDTHTYEWDFNGDGITDATGANVTHTFLTECSRDVKLTVRDDDGGVSTDTVRINVWGYFFEDPLNHNKLYIKVKSKSFKFVVGSTGQIFSGVDRLMYFSGGRIIIRYYSSAFNLIASANTLTDFARARLSSRFGYYSLYDPAGVE